MQLIHVGAAVLNQTPLAWDANKANILAAIGEARSRGVSILCLPELCITGYGCEDAFHAPGTQQVALEVLRELVPLSRGMIVSLGLPLLYHGSLFNTACVAADGKLLGFVGKQNLAGEGIHYEPRWFKPWPGCRKCTAPWFSCGTSKTSRRVRSRSGFISPTPPSGPGSSGRLRPSVSGSIRSIAGKARHGNLRCCRSPDGP